MALADPIVAGGVMEFFDQGASEPIWPENILSREGVIRVALEFYTTDGLRTSVRWAPRVWRDGTREQRA
jgi:hypothetical protein